MAYSGLPNGGNSMTSPQASASAAAFARKKLQAGMAAGLLPQNFNLAHTNANLLGQFHMLQPTLSHAANNGGATQDNLAAIMGQIGKLGQNNLVTRGGVPNFGGVNPMNPAGAVPGQQSVLPQGGFQNELLQMLFGQMFGGGQGNTTVAPMPLYGGPPNTGMLY